MNINKKYKAEFNPFSAQSPNGQYTIKTDDDVETPIAVVFVGFGTKDAKEKASMKAKRIVDALNYCRGIMDITTHPSPRTINLNIDRLIDNPIVMDTTMTGKNKEAFMEELTKILRNAIDQSIKYCE